MLDLYTKLLWHSACFYRKNRSFNHQAFIVLWGLVLCGKPIAGVNRPAWCLFSGIAAHRTKRRGAAQGQQDQLDAHLVAIIGLLVAERAYTDKQGHMPATHPSSAAFRRPAPCSLPVLGTWRRSRWYSHRKRRADDLLLDLGLLFLLGRECSTAPARFARPTHAIVVP